MPLYVNYLNLQSVPFRKGGQRQSLQRYFLALAVDGQGLVGERVGDHQGNQLLGEVIGAVVRHA